uniref:Uncharacterized protein n=1 Tax=Arundo donax TaxID=35708 RepID=A0A0A9D0N7_ARUDO
MAILIFLESLQLLFSGKNKRIICSYSRWLEISDIWILYTWPQLKSSHFLFLIIAL